MSTQTGNTEPSALERYLTKLAFLFCGNTVYKDFADRLTLNGSERVLDFGCGMGTVAYYAAKMLPRGQLTCADISHLWLNACRKTLRQYDNVVFQKLISNSIVLPNNFDLVYCHFVLHDISEQELAFTIPALSGCLKSGGMLIFREPLHEKVKLNLIKSLAEQNGLVLKDSRVTDIPYMGNALESNYIKI